MPQYKIIGQDTTPPDLYAKVTGRAKYAEDFRAEGMLFAKLLASPMPHARVRRIDASRALAMEGVVAILTADELRPIEGPGERALTNEPLYEGEAILAVAAVDETTAANAIEQIRVDLEPLPFVLEPLASMRPGSPSARSEGNVFVSGQEIGTLKWTAEQYATARTGRMPADAEVTDEWTIGDIEAGFAQAEVIVEEPLIHQSVTHHPMEPRSCMAYWQNGKLFLHGSTQSTARTRAAVANQLGLDIENVVLIAEYCGGGFGSKISGALISHVPALLARKTSRPVMLRITRAEENYLGRARPGFQGWVRMGFRRDGRMTAMDLFVLQDNGPYGRQGDFTTVGSTASLMYQPENMRFRGVPVITNTPPKTAQRGPGGAQAVAMLEPLVDKGARELGMDRVAVRRVNLPGHDGWLGPQKRPLTSAFAREALDLGAQTFGWAEKSRLSGQRRGTKVTGVGVAVSPYTAGSSGYDGLLVIRPDGKLYIHQGIGNLGTHSIADTGRAAAEVLGVPWDRVEIVWGNTANHLPWSSSQSGSQTTHAHTRANHAAAMDALRKLQEIAARDLGGQPSEYVVNGGRVYHRENPGRGMDFARVARRAIELGGKYDGHEVAEDLNPMTKASVAALAGQGFIAAAKDTYRHEGATYSWAIGFARVEVDVETGHVDVLEYTASTDCGTVMNPRGLAAQLHGGGVQGMGMARSQRWVFDPQWGIPFNSRFYTARPPGILDVPIEMKWAAVNQPDPQNPVGAKGIGEPPVGAGEASIVNAISDALGGKCFCRTPLTADMIVAFLEGRRAPYDAMEFHV